MTDQLDALDKRGFRAPGPPADGSTLDLDAAALVIDDILQRYTVHDCTVLDHHGFGAAWDDKPEAVFAGSEPDCRTWIAREIARACFRTLLPATDPMAEAIMWKACGTISKGTYKRKLEWAREGFAAAMAVVLGTP